MPIRCSNCGGTHPDARSVRECFGSASPAAPPATDPGAEEWAPGMWDEEVEPSSFPPPVDGSAISGPPPRPKPADGPPAAGAAATFLGRSVLVSPGDPAPEPWAACERIRVGSGAPTEVLHRLEEAYYGRKPLVIEVEPGWQPPQDEVEESPVWALSPAFSFPGERLEAAVLSNSVDAREPGRLLWRWASSAGAAGATVRPSGAAGSQADGLADVVLPGGQPAFVDGGPLTFPSKDWRGGGAAFVPSVTVEHGRLTPFRSNECRAPLAPDQLEAVTHPGGSARILAPAGSGKTRVLTERARHLLNAWAVPPQALCLVAFNKRAADEMKERTVDLPALQIRTLNSLGLAILSGTGRFGTGRSVETLDESGVRRILDELVSFPRRANSDPAAAWIEALSAVRLGLKSPEQVEVEFGGDVDGLAGLFDEYRNRLARRKVVDFDEQIYRAIEILLTSPQARRSARHFCRILLVDEFQDLTPAHLLLLRMLAGPAGSVFGVGDDDQTIYGYAGASPSWLIDYDSYFPAAGTHLLQVNYRCPPAVTAAARTLLTHNRVRVSKRIRSPEQRSGEGGLAVKVSDDPVAATVDAVREQIDGGAAPDTIAVLTRVNSSLAPVQLSLLEAGVRVNRAVDLRFLERTGVRAALGWLKIASRPDRLRAQDIGFTARRPPRALSPKVVEWMSEQRSVERLRALAARLGERDGDKVDNYADDVERLAELAQNAGTDGILRCLRDEIGLAAAMSALDTEHRRLDRSPQTDDLDALIALGRLHPDPATFESWLREGLATPGDPKGVTLATIHSVKGREWDRVVVHNATAGLIPHRLAFDIEEERRVFHVAITRCRSSCTVVAGTPESPFLEELSQEWQPSRQAVAATRTADPVISDRPAPGPAAPEPVVKMLKAWRLERAKREARPAYTILHDSTLEAIASSGARSLGELARIKGIGPAKLDSFGDEILAVLDAAGEG